MQQRTWARIANAVVVALNTLADSPMALRLGTSSLASLFSPSNRFPASSLPSLQRRCMTAISSSTWAFMLRCRSSAQEVGRCFAVIHRMLLSPSPSSFISYSSFSSSVFTNSAIPLPCESSSSCFSVPGLDHSYYNHAQPIKLVADLVALPSTAASVPLLKVLPPNLAIVYALPSQETLLPESEIEQAKLRSIRPSVLADRAQYIKLVARLHRVGIVAFSTHPRCINGAFGVPKKDKQRLIIAAQRGNLYFKRPPSVQLPNASHLSRLVVPARRRIYAAKGDLSNFFHNLRLPEWMWGYFGLPALTIEELASIGFHSVVPLHPVLCTLPMGFSHSVYLAQAVHEHLLQLEGIDLRCSLVNVTDPMALLLFSFVLAVYIDDLVVLALECEAANACLRRALTAYARNGLPVAWEKVNWASERAENLRKQEMLGMALDGVDAVLAASPEKLKSVLTDTVRVLCVGFVTGHDLRRLVGSWLWLLLLRRPLLSLLDQVYRFIAIAKTERFQLWPSVRSELLALCALSPFLCCSLRDGFYTELLATDASLAKGALAVTSFKPNFAELHSAVLWPLVHAPRSELLPPSRKPRVLSTLEHVKRRRSMAPVPQPARALYSVEQSPQHSAFYAVLADVSWRTIFSTAWRFQQHINVLEMRTVLLAVQWALSRPGSVDSRLVLLVDNSVSAYSLKKGRAKARSVQSVLRRVLAHLLVGRMSLLPVWIPSHINPADRPSRS